MSRTLKRLQSLGAKVGAFALSGVLALSMTPAIALANDGQSGLRTASVLVASESVDGSVLEYANSTGATKVIIGTSDPLNGGVELQSSQNNTYQYKGYAHSDNGSHYQAYSLYTKLTTDANGILTAIDVTSGNDTFAGKWGYQPAKVASGKGASTAIRGYLPTGFNFAVDKRGSVYSPKLSADDSAKGVTSTLNSIALVNVTQSGGGYNASDEKAVYAVTSERSGAVKVTKDDEFVAIDDSTGMPSVSLASDSGYNLVRCTYIIGSEQTAFDMYFFAGGNASVAKEYAQSALSPTTWTDSPTSGYSANRDRWMHIVGSVMLREFGSWGAVIQNEKLATETGLDGEIATLDTVSGATKTSSPFNQALEAAKKAEYVKGVSDNLVFTIDGEHANDSPSLPGIDVTKDSKDMSSVVTSNGNDVLSVVFPYKDTELTRADSHGVSLTKVSVYALKDQKVGTQGMMALAKQNSGSDEQPYKALKEYTAKDAVGSTWASADATASKNQVLRHKYVTAIDDDNITFEYERYDDPLLITLKNKDVTHVVMQYSMGHGTIAIAYDIASMKTVANADGKSSLAYDVQPFFAQTSDAQKLATSMLTSDEFTKTPGSIVLKDGKYVFTGEDIKPEIEKVLTKSGAELSSDEYTASYSDNKNAGTATVTVTLKNPSATLTSSSQKTFTIERALIGKPVAKSNLVYNGAPQTGVAAGAGYTVTGGSATNAGSYKATVKLDGNHAWKDGSTQDATVSYAIARAQIDKPVAKSNLVYNGAPQTGVAAGAGYTVTGGSATNAGSYKATVKLDGNHAWKDGSTQDATVSYAIAPASSSIKLAAQSKTYTGKALAYSGKVTKTGSTGKVTYSYYSDAACKKAVKAANVKNAGTYYVKATVAAAGNYAAATSPAAKLTVKKASQTIEPAKTYSVKYSKVKKKAQTIVVKFKANGGGKVTYAAAKSGKVSIAKNGKVTVKKGTAKKTYTLKVKVTAAEKGNYAKTVKTVNLKVKVS